MGGRQKRALQILALIIFDMFLVFAAYLLALLIRYGSIGSMAQINQALANLPWLSLLFCGLFFVFKLYHSLWRYSGVFEAVRIVFVMVIGMAACLLCNYVFHLGLSVLVLVLFGFVLMILVGASRFGYRMTRHIVILQKKSRRDIPTLLIVGAGFSGALAISRLQSEKKENFHNIILVDDDEKKQNMMIRGVRVVGRVKDIPDIVKTRCVKEIIIAIPSLKPGRLSEILKTCNLTGCRTRMMPLLQEMDGDGKVYEKMREVKIADVLFRREVDLDIPSIGHYLNNKNVLVTGGGGSIGSEICRQVARFSVRSLTIFDIYENTAYELMCELKERYGDKIDVRVEIGSVRDRARLRQVFEACRPQIIFHSAAHKHVPLMEKSPLEAIKNNVGGTLNVLKAANDAGAERFVQLSTDKAVNPTNIMGATKRAAELMVQSYERKTKMKCMTVRFGNVIGSHGSVIPLMERQIKNGGPVTLTHPEITRYFMTIPEAAQLVLQAGSLADPGVIYVLDMGEPVKIADLADKLIRFYGHEPNVDIEVKITGLRPGEKMYEELMMSEEKSVKTVYGHIYRVQPQLTDMDWLDEQIRLMLEAAEKNEETAVGRLKKIVPNYQPAGGKVLPIGKGSRVSCGRQAQIEYNSVN